MSEAKKDTIYIDIDDEITSIIEKVKSSPQKIVALVLPKRAAVLQSMVNMKLLKRGADEAKKQPVLITSEAALLPLAGAAGVHVAKSLQSKPEVPEAPEIAIPEETVTDDAADDTAEEESKSSKLDLKKSIGALAGLTSKKDEEEPIDLENEDGGDDAETEDAPLDKKLKIPNFNSFRKRLIFGGAALVLLIVLWAYAFVIAPKAKITIKTDSTTVNSSLNVTLDTAQKSLDEEKLVLPATAETYKKTDTQKVAATGEKNVGTKATGTVSLKNCSNSDGSFTIPAGTGISTNNLTFITQETVTLPASLFSGGGTCVTSSEDVGVTAQSPGEDYNVAGGRTFAVSGYDGVTGTNDAAFSGGTNKIVKVVSAGDIETAKQKLVSGGDAAAEDQLKKQFEQKDMMAVDATLVAGTASVTSSPAVGEEASEVTVASETVYTMLGVQKADLSTLLDADMKKQIDESRQTLLDNGLDKATFRSNDKNDKTAKVTVISVGLAGAQLDAEQIRKDAAGKKKGAVVEELKQRPGVKDVEVTYSPFWVLSVPKKASHITVIIEQPDQNPSTASDEPAN